MRIRELHRWDVSPAEARALQADLAPRVRLEDAVPLDAVQTVAGVDNTYVKEGDATTAHAVVVVLSFPALEIIETAFASRPVAFPYVPGLLSFREAPAVLAAFEQVAAAPDAVLFDGQGYAHPRRFGLACHLGLILDLPSVGCAKSRLVGRWEEPERAFGAQTPLVDRGETVGAAVRTRPRRAPLFVSPGHKVSVAGAVGLALACCRDGTFMPEPTRLAHEAVTARGRAAGPGPEPGGAAP
ncbi:MAG: Endonuclease V [uncultured Thermomicrobiales bacterium]|uniref:Endonuclease V n=1 Tax=uncultured Thermomicrobiales bacterium TaxID=1645740 RepID=A0A6J4V681_9BACT|nr:MAG: Endonuclease V [uncultured Thermomicrobiales bacterium]